MFHSKPTSDKGIPHGHGNPHVQFCKHDESLCVQSKQSDLLSLLQIVVLQNQVQKSEHLNITKDTETPGGFHGHGATPL